MFDKLKTKKSSRTGRKLSPKMIIGIAITVVILASGAMWFQLPKNEEFWCEEDFLFYDINRDIALESTMQSPLIYSLAPTDECYTYRGMKVGDDAATALKRYKWVDFELTIFKHNEMQADNALTKSYNDKVKNIDDFIALIPELVQNQNAAKLTMVVYKQNGKLVTRSKLKNKDNLQPFEKLKYILAVEMEDSVIDTITIENNYYRELAKCYQINNGLIPETEEYGWLRALGEGQIQ